MYRVDILIVHYVRKGLNTKTIEIAVSVRRRRLEHRSHRHYYTALRKRAINDFPTYLAVEIVTQSLGRYT